MPPDLFDEFVQFILQREGGYNDDPEDPGGATNYGISLRFYRDIMPRATKNDIKVLSRADAIALYKQEFWIRPGCYRMPPAIGLLVFDGGINQGRSKCVTMLQRAMVMPPQSCDGVYGPNTEKLSHSSYSMPLINRLAARRAVAYGEAAKFSKYGMGWLNRLMDVHEYAIRVYNRS